MFISTPMAVHGMSMGMSTSEGYIQRPTNAYMSISFRWKRLSVRLPMGGWRWRWVVKQYKRMRPSLSLPASPVSLSLSSPTFLHLSTPPSLCRLQHSTRLFLQSTGLFFFLFSTLAFDHFLRLLTLTLTLIVTPHTPLYQNQEWLSRFWPAHRRSTLTKSSKPQKKSLFSTIAMPCRKSPVSFYKFLVCCCASSPESEKKKAQK